MNNYVEEWGESYCGRVLSRQDASNEEYEWTHIWDIKINDPNQFKTAHDKIVKTFKKEFEGIVSEMAKTRLSTASKEGRQMGLKNKSNR